MQQASRHNYFNPNLAHSLNGSQLLLLLLLLLLQLPNLLNCNGGGQFTAGRYKSCSLALLASHQYFTAGSANTARQAVDARQLTHLCQMDDTHGSPTLVNRSAKEYICAKELPKAVQCWWKCVNDRPQWNEENVRSCLFAFSAALKCAASLLVDPRQQTKLICALIDGRANLS